MKAPPGLAKFDSASAMVQALAAFLRGEEFSGLAIIPSGWEALGGLINTLPRSLREQVYIWSGWWEAVAGRHLADFQAEDVSRWMIDPYPRRRYPAVALGSSSGALTHLCAALGIPWLPQTFLLLVQRSGISPDEPIAEMKWGVRPARQDVDDHQANKKPKSDKQEGANPQPPQPAAGGSEKTKVFHPDVPSAEGIAERREAG